MTAQLSSGRQVGFSGLPLGSKDPGKLNAHGRGQATGPCYSKPKERGQWTPSEGPAGLADAWWLVGRGRGILTNRELPAHGIFWQHSEN